MTSFRKFDLGVAGCSVIWLVCCSSGNDGGTFDSGVEPGTTLSALEADEVRTICEAEIDYRFSVASNEVYCKAGVMSASGVQGDDDASLRSACTSAYESCLETATDLVEASRDQQIRSCTTFPGNISQWLGCDTATVADFEECETEGFQTAVKMLNELPECSSITKAALDEYRGHAEADVPSCKSLQASCFPE